MWQSAGHPTGSYLYLRGQTKAWFSEFGSLTLYGASGGRSKARKSSGFDDPLNLFGTGMPVFCRAIVLQQHGTSAAHFLYDTERTCTEIAESTKSYKEKIHPRNSGLKIGPKTGGFRVVSVRYLCWNQRRMADAREWTPPLSVAANTKWEFKSEGYGAACNRHTYRYDTPE